MYWIFFNRKSLPLEEMAARAKASVSDQDIRKTWILFGDPKLRTFIAKEFYKRGKTRPAGRENCDVT